MATRPNILFFHIDNVSQGDFGVYGGAVQMGAATPNIDALSEGGLVMSDYNVEAQCTPTRSALMTGRYSARTGAFNALPGAGIVAWEATVAEHLKELGYRNAIFGKWHVGEEPGRYPTDKGFDYWYGLHGTWDKAYWAQDRWFRKEDIPLPQIIESKDPGDLSEVKVLDANVRRDIDLDFLEKATAWMEESVAAGEPFFIYFNHSNIHFPTIPRQEFEGSSNGGAVADCINMIDADLGTLVAKLDELDIADDTIVIIAGDNGRDTSFHAPNNRSARGHWRGGYFSTYEGNNRTIGVIRWPGKVEPGRTDEMLHVTDWFPTLLSLVGAPESVPDDRVIDGVDQSAFLTGDQETSNRNHFHMFFDGVHVGMRYKNFKVLTHRVESGDAPIEKLGTPHIYNLTVNPDEDVPYNYADGGHSWVLYEVYMPKTRSLMASLQSDGVPFGAPVDYVPHAQKGGPTPVDESRRS